MNPGQTPAIEFRNVSISFDDVQALKNAGFTLPCGEMICITGDSDSSNRSCYGSRSTSCGPMKARF